MKEQLRILSQLQQLEQRKHLILSKKAGINADEVRSLWQEIKLLSQVLAADKEELVGLEKVCARQEGDILHVTKQCQELEGKLYGGEITNLKEMEQVKHNCEVFRKDIAVLENETMTNMEHGEQLTAKIAGNEAALVLKKRLHAEKQQVIAKMSTEFDGQLSEVEVEYSELVSKVEPSMLVAFKDIGRRIALPVAKVENGICGGCRMSVPVNQVAFSTKMIFCDNCGRILFVE